LGKGSLPLPPIAHCRQSIEKFGGGRQRGRRRCLIPRQRAADRRAPPGRLPVPCQKSILLLEEDLAGNDAGDNVPRTGSLGRPVRYAQDPDRSRAREPGAPARSANGSLKPRRRREAEQPAL
jgi:hypothetical protein